MAAVERSLRHRIEQLEGEPVIDPDLAGEIGARQLLSVLDLDRRTAFVLTQLFRLSYEQAASVCGCPAGTIRSRVARARDDLIVALGQTMGERDVGLKRAKNKNKT